MKTRILKSAAVLVLVCVLALSLTGCDKLSYRKAINLYNAGKYDAAAKRFGDLGDYENSADLLARSQYRAAITVMEEGNFQEALTRFTDLGDYEDSQQRVAECTYQIAVEAFEAGSFTDAETHFQKIPGYRQTLEYMRRINWQRVFDAVAAAGPEDTGSVTLQKVKVGKVYRITADTADPNQLIFHVYSMKNMGYNFYDAFTLTLTRDSKEAAFTSTSTFTMEMNGTQIGSQQAASGTVDISTCTPETILQPDTFEKTVTDNHGKTTRSTDPADSTMNDTMTENLNALMTVIPELLLDAGIEVTLADLGFTAM